MAAHKAEIKGTSSHVKREIMFFSTLRKVFRNKGSILGLIILSTIIILAVFAPRIAPYGYAEINISKMFAHPSSEHWFGCDELGRDILSRVLYGARYSLQIGFFATFLSVVGGVILGSIVGFYGGMVDNVVMRLVDIIQAIPGILLSIAVSAVLGNGVFELVIALAVGNLAPMCRILRGSILTVRKSEYLDAAVADNTSSFRMITRHILPNSISPIIVQATFSCANAILLAASLSFIGMGIQPPNPEWGAMLSTGRRHIRDHSHMLTFPGMAIALTVLSLNLLGDGLRDALDPKLKR